MIVKFLSQWSEPLCGLLTLCLLAGCAGDGPAPLGSASTFDTIQQTIFNVRCLSAGCHNSADQGGNLVLEAGLSFTNLVNVTPFNQAAAADGLLRVTPGHPELSYLFTKLTLPTASDPQLGSRMPLGAEPLSAADIELIRDWILAGAPGPEVPTASRTVTATASVTPTTTWSPTNSPTPLDTATPTITPTGTQPSTATVTATLPPSATPSVTPTSTASPTPSAAPTPTFSLLSTFPQIQANIFTPTCLGLGCHDVESQAGGNILDADHAYASLVGVTPSNLAAAAAGLLRVTPGDPVKSYLITKLTLPAAFDPQLGSRMPLGKPVLTPDQIEQIRAWILRGALPNE